MNPLMDQADSLLLSLILGTGWDIKKMTPQFGAMETVASHYSYTALDITGQGIFTGIHSTNRDFSIQVDGGPILRFYAYSSTRYSFWPMFLPFKQSLVVKSSGSIVDLNYATALVGTGGDLTKMTHVCAQPATTHKTYTVVDIAGAGLLLYAGTNAAPTAGQQTFAIQVDGGSIYPYWVDGTASMAGFLIPFTTGLKITSTQSTGRALYVLK